MAAGTSTIAVRHLGGDRLGIQVREHELGADQPVEGGGEDTAPTPTELFLAGLASCVAFYAERFLRRHGLSTDGLVVSCEHTWAKDPTRVGQIDMIVEAPGLTTVRLEAFSPVVAHCPVHNTLCSRRRCASGQCQQRRQACEARNGRTGGRQRASGWTAHGSGERHRAHRCSGQPRASP